MIKNTADPHAAHREPGRGRQMIHMSNGTLSHMIRNATLPLAIVNQRAKVTVAVRCADIDHRRVRRAPAGGDAA